MAESVKNMMSNMEKQGFNMDAIGALFFRPNDQFAQIAARNIQVSFREISDFYQTPVPLGIEIKLVYTRKEFNNVVHHFYV